MNGMSTMGYLPPQHVPTAKSEESLKRLRIAPDSDVLIMDDNDPVVYLCTTDSLGNMSYEAFDLVKRKTEAERKQDQFANALLLINQRLENLEAMLNESTIEESTQTTVESSAESSADKQGVGYYQVGRKSTAAGRAVAK